MKVLVVEDHIMFLEYVVSLLKKQENILDILIASNGKDAFGLLHENKIDLLITDLNIPKLNGIRLIEKTRIYYPKIKIVVLTQYQNKGLLRKLKELKVDGFLTFHSSQDDLNEMLATVVSGNFSFITDPPPSNNLDHLCGDEKLLTDSFMGINSLSKRETVISHRKNIYRKLEVNNILDLYKLVTKLK